MKRLIEKADILTEALPYIRNFCGKRFVIKYGGAVQIEPRLNNSFAQDVVLLNFIGIRPIVVHGGGPRINEIMRKMGKEPAFVCGHRITDKETMEIVEMVLGGLINKEIVALINSHGGRAVGLSGKDGGLIKARKKLFKETEKSAEEEIVDIGLVGEVESIAPEILSSLEKDGFIPVISPIGAGGARGNDETYNINADNVASAIAGSLKAEKLILLTDVPGISDGKGDIIPTLPVGDIKGLVSNGTISGGMLPKVQAGISAIKAGVKKVHIVDGRIPHCLLLEIFTKGGIGTEIVHRSLDPK